MKYVFMGGYAMYPPEYSATIELTLKNVYRF